MLVYSHEIIKFIARLKKVIKQVLAEEVGLSVFGERFFDRNKKFSYPISVVIYNDKPAIGYFDPDFFELGFHERLMRVTQEQLGRVVRHEIAHYMTFITHGPGVMTHGEEFRDFCRQRGWGEEVYRSTICLEESTEATSLEQSQILRKIQKLMALSASCNPYEAEQAMIKARQLLLKHHLDGEHMAAGGPDEKMFLKRLLKQKKATAKMRCIGKILETFFVSTVFSRASGHVYLEILGDAVNVEISEHVAHVLQIELDRLWGQAKQQNNSLKGAASKNCFFMGIAKGYCNKIEALKRTCNAEVHQALVCIEKSLEDARRFVYKRLRQTRTSGNLYSPEAAAMGEQYGAKLQINPAVAQSRFANLSLDFITKY